MKKLCFLDCETTGLVDPRLVQLGFAVNNGPINVTIYKPPKGIEDAAAEKHGITDEQVSFYELFEQSRRQIQRLLEDSIPIAHNLPFDKRVLQNEGLDVPDGICTLKLAKRLYPALKKHKLGFLAESLGIPHNKEDLHNASEDVRILRELFKRQIMSILCKDPEKSKMIMKMVEVTKRKQDQDLDSLDSDYTDELVEEIFYNR